MAVVWGLILIAGILSALVSGGGETAMNAMLAGAKEAVSLSIELAGAYLMFMGLVGVARAAGLMEKLSRALSGVTRFLFPNAGEAAAPIALTFAANMLGMGNAATPFGLSAMQALQKSNKKPSAATNEMCTFLLINSSCLQLVPTGLIALRQAAGSAESAAIILPSLAASAVATAFAVLLCKLLFR